jgi:SAM-dependent methyltransferase
MRPVEDAIREVRRVLRPGGGFVAIVGGGLPPECGPNAWSMLADHFRREVFVGPSIGDRRVYTEEGLRSFPTAHIRSERKELTTTQILRAQTPTSLTFTEVEVQPR